MNILKQVPSAHLPLAMMTALAVLFSLPCAAHHSAAIFNAKQSAALHGTVKLFQWTNPHCRIQMLEPSRGAQFEPRVAEARP